MADLLTGVATFAFTSRLFIILIQILANNIIPDHEAHVFDPPVQRANDSYLDSLVEFGVGGFRRWDAVYFTHIAQFGYTYENCAAFFPLFPLIVSFLAKILFISGLLQFPQCVLLAGVVANCLFFSLAASCLYKLSNKNNMDRTMSIFSVLIFCINPASIFMTAPYSESLYVCLLMLSLVYLKKRLIFRASFCMAISILTRSNGIVGIGFILHSLAQDFVSDYITVTKEKKDIARIWKRLVSLILRASIKTVLCLVICISPFLLYQYYIYTKFCFPSLNSIEIVPTDLVNYGRQQNYKIVGDSPSPWCFHKFPMSYSYIQEKHWGVGFLKYYQFKQIPNFLLALPVVILSVSACIFFFKLNPKAFYSLGLLKNHVEKTKGESYDEMDDGSGSTNRNQMVVYIFHLAFLTIFGCCFVHIQVLTRLLFSSSPLLYWYSGKVLGNNPALVSKLQKLIGDEAEVYRRVDDDSETSHRSRSPSGDYVNGGETKTHTTCVKQDLVSGVTCRRSLKAYKYKQDGMFASKFNDVKSSLNIFVNILIVIMKDYRELTNTSKAVFGYCVFYLVIGTVMFSNFLPWT